MTAPTFPALDLRHVRWRATPDPADGTGEGLEHLTIRAAGREIHVNSVVIGQRGGSPYGLQYYVFLDPQWRTLSFSFFTTAGAFAVYRSRAPGTWTDADGNRLRAFDGCVDIDLAGTPFTNTLPIRRLSLGAGESAELTMLYLPFDDFAPRPDRQRYTCLEPGARYLYEAVDRDWRVELSVDADGLVVDYPGLFTRLSL